MPNLPIRPRATVPWWIWAIGVLAVILLLFVLFGARPNLHMPGS
jgi:hypothetical protein